LASGKGGLLETEHEGRLLFRFPFEGEEFLPELVEFLTMAVEIFDRSKKRSSKALPWWWTTSSGMKRLSWKNVSSPSYI
jgi:hypothetical protein